MSATTIGISSPKIFQGAYLKSLTSSLGLAQSPSTANLTLVEDENSSPKKTFIDPEVGSYKQVDLGQFSFGGVVTSYEKDIRANPRLIRVNLADPREIMKSITMILAPGYRQIAEKVKDGHCAYLDVFGAYDDFDNTGINLSGWNQAGMTYERIALVFKGGSITDVGFAFDVEQKAPQVFGQKYRFNLDEVTAKVDSGYRVNTNLINVSDFIQELANRHSFDWLVTSELASDGYVDVTIKTIDRSIDNTDLDIDSFVASNSGIISQMTRGYELRNEVACTALLGAPVEELAELTIKGLANNPIDLSDEGGHSKYHMTEEEMRFVLGGRDSWETWLKMNGGLIRYTVGGAATLAPVVSPADASDIGNQIGINPDRFSITTADQEILGRIYEKLKGHAESTYGKRFLFPTQVDSEIVDAAWTADAISGNNDPKEYFRNDEGKTRCFVEFSPSNKIQFASKDGVLGFAGNYGFGLGANAPQPLNLDLKDSFSANKAVTEVDKSDWIVNGGKLYIAGTIEEGNVVRIDSPVIFHLPKPEDGIETVAEAGPGGNQNTAGGSFEKKVRNNVKRAYVNGAALFIQVHAKCYQPSRVFVPVRSKFNRYGPIVSSDIDSNEGKLVIEQDDGFSPWEFGSTSLMLDAMQFRVDNSSSNVKKVENARITTVGLPKFSIGDSLGKNSNISNISINFGNPTTTQYELRAFLRKFGELSKEELAALSLFARRGGARILPQDMVGFINKYRPIISKQFGGRGSQSTSATNGGADSFE